MRNVSFSDIVSNIIKENLTLSHIKTHFDTSATDDFWTHRDKERNCSKQTISPFAILFSTFSVIVPTIRNFPQFFCRHFQICCMWERVNSLHAQGRFFAQQWWPMQIVGIQIGYDQSSKLLVVSIPATIWRHIIYTLVYKEL